MDDMFGLYLVMTDPVVGYEACAEAAVRCGVRYLQLRMKGATRDAVLETALRVREITLGSNTLFIVNDDVTIARDVDADGVHLGQRDLPLAEARRLWPSPGKRFGLSTHNEQEAVLASRLSPDYIGVGPVFATPTKAVPDPVLGPERMGTIIRSVPVPAVVLGGIDCGNLAEVLRRGARNFCVVRAVTRRPDPETAIRELGCIWRKEMGAG
ncbi:MAG: thiamine phosphate synthase [Deltaproteobacteria bacterium]|jgi:thiamine-phosphate pyrophosphorylase|nr:MAG: thiamine phosphate synthase [Deltaproteobacteria bacterium]